VSDIRRGRVEPPSSTNSSGALEEVAMSGAEPRNAAPKTAPTGSGVEGEPALSWKPRPSDVITAMRPVVLRAKST
jgi:hypothetical protein